ncbi:hypothetical protein GCM10022281_05180 [Sphingomonas rosea]|uniref:AAA+ ATPase domain-containing protein n=2 Tax=Sphingomonas rosea TaxID=335605 RepID=A0ABP7TPC0_9SPHN
MGWYESVSQFAAEQIGGRSRANSSPAFDEPRDGLMLRDGDREPEHRAYEAMMPLLSIPRHLDTTALDQVYMAFDVSQPVGQPEDLRGRDQEVKGLLSGVLHRRNHGIVSGPRGSGKTSLVRVFGQYADREGVVVLYSACDDGTSFGELIRSYLEQIPPAMVDPSMVELFEQRVISFGADSSPYQATGVLSMLKYSQLVVVLDEFDRITDPEMHDKISSLLKLVSDARLPVRFVLVGGNSAFADIVRAHPSMMRHITRVSTAPLSGEAIDDLLDSCAERCNLAFSDSSRELIREVACGSPYHARLFGMHGALNALAASSNAIELEHVESGLDEAFEEWSMLNPEDAQVFRDIMQGRFGAAGTLTEFARRVAWHNADDDFARDWKLQGRPSGEPPAVIADLAPTVQMIDGHATFRDATAPQFLLALSQVRQPSAPRLTGGARA